MKHYWANAGPVGLHIGLHCAIVGLDLSCPGLCGVNLASNELLLGCYMGPNRVNIVRNDVAPPWTA